MQIALITFGTSIISPTGIAKIDIGSTKRTKIMDCFLFSSLTFASIVTKPLNSDTGTSDKAQIISHDVAVESGYAAIPLTCKPKTMASDITNAPTKSATIDTKNRFLNFLSIN